jgi:hypothetical protein
MLSNLTKYLATLSLLCVSFLAMAEGALPRTYTLPDHGSIRLMVPESWQDEVRQRPEGLPPTIIFTPKNGTLFQILLTPVFSRDPGMVMPAAPEIKASVEWAAENTKSQAVEESIPVNELSGAEVIGYYFSATDKAPKPDEYEYLTQGMFRLGELAPTFTILTNDGAQNVVAESLTMLRNAVHIQAAAAPK